jgi:hypothetical protein
MSTGYGIGDHHLFVVDVLMSSLVGSCRTKIVCAEARRLNTKLHRAAKKYLNEVERLTVQHSVIERVGCVH